jgi:ribA/ribD-fused uncharacterized protein
MNDDIRIFSGEFDYMSNFYFSKTVIGKFIYDTVEHYFQSRKAVTDREEREIRETSTPGKAKRMGRKIKIRADWEKIKYDVMFIGVKFKFEQHPDIAKKLKVTGDRLIVEGNNWHDNIWGDCHCPKCEHIIGKNLMGKILMEIRKEL